MDRYRRTLKKFFSGTSKKREQFDTKKVIGLIMLFATIIFIFTQLITNAILSPLGHKLQSLNTEKNLLIEKNRELEEKIAKGTSLTIIQTYSQNKFKLSPDAKKKSIFVSDSSTQALKP